MKILESMGYRLSQLRMLRSSLREKRGMQIPTAAPNACQHCASQWVVKTSRVPRLTDEAEGSGRMTGDMSNTVDVNNKSRIERGGRNTGFEYIGTIF